MSSRINSVQLDIDDIMSCIKSSTIRANTEEDVRVRVSGCIEEKILKPLNIQNFIGKYEYTLVSGDRTDALYGHVVVEYKRPGKLSSENEIQDAKNQVIKYIKTDASDKSDWTRYLGVIISDRIAFVKYDPRNNNWVIRGPYNISHENIVKLVEALRGLSRKNLDVNSLIEDFGPGSRIATNIINLLYNKLKGSNNPRTRTLFDDWMRLFKQATGYDPKELEDKRKFANEYGLKDGADYDALIFSIHTHYALIMKLLAAEIAYIYGGGRFYRSYIAGLDDAYSGRGVDGVGEVLKELESGGMFRNLLNIENFLEGDYFSWYLDELDNDLADSIAEIARILSDYEIATPQLEPEFARDLLKRLYQNLVPRDLRHKLGEFYTPDWLASLVLDEVGLSLDNLLKNGKEDTLKPLKIRVLDPACGSGTFLVLYISMLRRYAEEHYLTDQLLNYILENVAGFDLNPLAVLAARTNYLLAVADLLGYARRRIEIPIYLSDSVMIEKSSQLTGEVYTLRAVVGEFRIPMGIIDEGLLPEILAEITMGLRNNYRPDEFEERIKYRFKEKIKEHDIGTLTDLYKVLLKLEQEGKDNVWISVLRNAFAPILKGKFDYVVGNPPWVNWENLPEGYRETSKGLWDKYGLAEISGKTGLGKVKRDLAMLFLTRCLDLYLKVGGKLGLLIPFTAFKVQAGAGFRDFLARKTRINVVHDLVTMYPFEGAVNRTAAIVVEKICNLSDTNDLSKCPQIDEVRKDNISGVKHVIWVNSLKKPIPTDMPLEEVLKNTKRYETIITPVIPNNPYSPWMQVTRNVVGAISKLVTGVPYYKAHAGVYVGLNQVYYVKVLEKFPDEKLKITNPPESGQKKEVKKIEAIVEPDLVYPLVRGRDIKRWEVGYVDRYIIVPHDPKNGKPLAEKNLKIKLPLTYEYLNNYRDILENRSIQKLWGKGNPFYSVYDIGSYTFASYKVVWKRISGAITGKAVSFTCAVLEPLSTDFVSSKSVITDDGTIIIDFNDRDEAYYVAVFLNSSIVRAVVAAYTYELRQETHIVDIIRIPKYDPKNELHRKISELAKNAQALAREFYNKNAKGLEDELKRIEDELDVAVAELLGLSDTDISEFRKLLAILSGEELIED